MLTTFRHELLDQIRPAQHERIDDVRELVVRRVSDGHHELVLVAVSVRWTDVARLRQMVVQPHERLGHGHELRPHLGDVGPGMVGHVSVSTKGEYAWNRHSVTNACQK